jgi:hypothetical protein
LKRQTLFKRKESVRTIFDVTFWRTCQDPKQFTRTNFRRRTTELQEKIFNIRDKAWVRNDHIRDKLGHEWLGTVAITQISAPIYTIIK